jgi:hypothetical protein
MANALPIVRDEFRPAIPRSGCSPAGPVSASPAHSAYFYCRLGGNRLSSNGNESLDWLSQLRGAGRFAATLIRLLNLSVPTAGAATLPGAM